MMYIFLSFLVVCMVYISYVIFDIIGQKKFSKDNDYPFTIVFSLDFAPMSINGTYFSKHSF